jgi:hypothetical protein
MGIRLPRFHLCAAALVLAASLAVTPTSRAQGIEPGASKEEVHKTYGPPQSRGEAGKKEIYVYKEGTITFKDGVVTEVRFLKGEPKRLPTPTPQPTATPVPNAVVATTDKAGVPLAPEPSSLLASLKTSSAFLPVVTLGTIALVLLFASWLFKKMTPTPPPEFVETPPTPAPGLSAPTAPSALNAGAVSSPAPAPVPAPKPAAPAPPVGPKPQVRLAFPKGGPSTPRTQYCPKCNVKMVLNEGDHPFLSCPNAPKCTEVLHV